MTTFRPCVQKQRADGFYPVYIRVTHDRKVGYIKTDKMVAKKDVTKKKEIRDNFVMMYCMEQIHSYTARLNEKNTTTWSVKDIIDFLLTEETDISFSNYAKRHIAKMINAGQERNAKNYKLAVSNLELYLGTNNVMFSQLTSAVVNRWIAQLAHTHRAKEMYPVCVRQIFRAAILEYNDYDTGHLRIKTNPWPKVKIPQADRTTKRAISPEACREFFGAPLPETKMIESLPELGRDVAKMILCLAGINTVDLYNLKKTDYRNGIIAYNRAKTRNSRRDDAYIEMRVPPVIKPLFDKYAADKADPYLFRFHIRYSTSDSFCANVNNGIKKICKSMGMEQKDYYCAYTFRHTWGTVAQNDCDANLFEVAFGMNHSHGLKVTRGYVRIDFTPAWRLNAKVIDFIFFSNQPSKQGKAKDIDESEDKMFRLSPKMMVYGRAYFKGEVLAEITDMGFNTIQDVISALAKKLHDYIPNGCAVHFRLLNCDTQKEVVYERTKGKGF